MPANRLPYFPLYTNDYLNDPAVMGMSAEAEGCYISLLARAWRLPEPGVVPVALAWEMSRAYRVPPDNRDRVMAEVAAAFDLESCPGFWTQRRMVAECRKAQALTAANSRGGRKSAQIRRLRSTLSSPLQDPTQDPCKTLPKTLGAMLDVEESKEEPKHLSDSIGRRVAVRKKKPIEPDGFADWYAAYPRHVARLAAAKAYRKALTLTDAPTLMAGAVAYRAAVADREPDKVKMPATWLNGGCWMDEAASADTPDDCSDWKP